MAGFLKTVKKYPGTFWVANVVELFERWGWYGMYMVLALYLTGSTDTGALGLSQIEKGTIMGIGTAILYFLPVITGAIADKVGYKKILIISFIIYAAGFLLLGQVAGFWPVFVVYLFVAIGSALFKPIPAATVAKSTDDSTSSIGFGIYYMMVNIGAVIGPVFAAKLRPHEIVDKAGNFVKDAAGKPMLDGGNWNNVFLLSAGIMVISLILVALFYKEPDREKSKEPLGKTISVIISNVFSALKDYKLVMFLILVVGFWTMFNQLYYTLPIFIDQWVDTTILYNAIDSFNPWIASKIGTESGTISAEMITTLDAFFIVIFQIVVSTVVMKWKPLNAMITGIFICSFGMGLSFLTQNSLFLVLSLFIFSIGEMSSSPKITEYLGRIASSDKKALYVGCAFLPIAGGNFFAGMLSGVYQTMADKITLLQQEVAIRGLSIPDIGKEIFKNGKLEEFTQNDYLNRACELMNMTPPELTSFLWGKYNPNNFWLVITGIGLATVILLILLDKFVLKAGKLGEN